MDCSPASSANRSGDDETTTVGALGEAIRGCKVYTEIPKLIAQALADGLSLEGAGEALSIGAAGLFLRSLTGKPDGRAPAYVGPICGATCSVSRRLQHEEQAAGAADMAHGPEVKSTQYRMEPTIQPDMDAVAALPHRSQEELLEAITQSIYNQPPTDWSKVTNLGMMRAVPEVKATVNLAQQYVELRYDPQVLMHRLAEIVCHDSFHRDARLQASPRLSSRSFRNTREPWALDASGRRLPGRRGLLRQEHVGLRGRAGADARRIVFSPARTPPWLGKKAKRIPSSDRRNALSFFRPTLLPQSMLQTPRQRRESHDQRKPTSPPGSPPQHDAMVAMLREMVDIDKRQLQQAWHRRGRRGGAALHAGAGHSRRSRPPAEPRRLPARPRCLGTDRPAMPAATSSLMGPS